MSLANLRRPVVSLALIYDTSRRAIELPTVACFSSPVCLSLYSYDTSRRAIELPTSCLCSLQNADWNQNSHSGRWETTERRLETYEKRKTRERKKNTRKEQKNKTRVKTRGKQRQRSGRTKVQIKTYICTLYSRTNHKQKKSFQKQNKKRQFRHSYVSLVSPVLFSVFS